MSEKLISIVTELKERTANFDASGKPFLAIQITLKDLGASGEAFYVEVKDDKLSIEASEYEDRQANVIMNSDDFMKMINGELNSLMALTTGKLKIKGDLTKAKALSELFKK
jgi:putative sterol carrier protein